MVESKRRMLLVVEPFRQQLARANPSGSENASAISTPCLVGLHPTFKTQLQSRKHFAIFPHRSSTTNMKLPIGKREDGRYNSWHRRNRNERR